MIFIENINFNVIFIQNAGEDQNEKGKNGVLLVLGKDGIVSIN